jgi:hypothetical protein
MEQNGNLFTKVINKWEYCKVKLIYNFLFKIVIFCIPLVVLTLLFWFFEPYDYWGIRKNSHITVGDTSNPVAMVRDFENTPSSNILLGASRLAGTKIDSSLLPGEVYNLAYGGATMRECISLFWFATEEYKLENVFFELSFYSLNEYHNGGVDRITGIIKSSKNPIQYMTNSAIIRAAVLRIINILFQRNNMVKSEVTALPSDEKKEEIYLPYAMNIKRNCENYRLSENDMSALEGIADYCSENNINLVFFACPVHHSIWENVIFPLSLEDKMNTYKERLSRNTIIRDMEYESYLSYQDNNFSDGFHFQNKLKDEVIYTIITGTGKEYRLWEYGNRTNIPESAE